MNNATEYPAAVRMGVMTANAWLRSFVSNFYYYIYSGDTEKLMLRFDFPTKNQNFVSRNQNLVLKNQNLSLV